jgi:hypothetical protein
MSHTVYVVQGNKTKNITELVGSLGWSSSIDALGVELNFKYAYNDTKYFENSDILELGDHIALFNNGKVLHRFVIVSEGVSGRFGKDYKCFDYSWYLNKNEVVIQFKKISASNALGKLLDKFGIKHKIVNIPTLITKIYKDQSVSDVINDILEQVLQETGIKYVMEMNIDTLVISKRSDLIINPMVSLTSNTAKFPVVNAISNPSRTRSIEEMKNKVIVVSDDEKSTKIFTESSDSNSISKYGLMTEVVTVDKKNVAQTRNIAKNTLADLNRVKEDISLDLLGHDDIRAGRILNINEPVTGIVGQYVINSANHTVSNGIHRVNVSLKGVK